jgi:hypothetical protein
MLRDKNKINHLIEAVEIDRIVVWKGKGKISFIVREYL